MQEDLWDVCSRGDRKLPRAGKRRMVAFFNSLVRFIFLSYIVNCNQFLIDHTYIFFFVDNSF